jgi:hypothetical protein
MRDPVHLSSNIQSERQSMPKLTGILVILAVLLAGCQAPGEIRPQPADQDFFRKMTNPPHHWGQPGQSRPNQGWSDYGYLKIDAGGVEDIEINQTDREWLAEIHAPTERGGRSTMRALSLQGVGVFYSPKDRSWCERYEIERVGTYVELLMFFLSEAFPGGPESISGSQSSRASGGAAEIRFLQGVMRLESPWAVETQVRAEGAGRYQARISHKQGRDSSISLIWEKQSRTGIDASEKIADWQPCWLGIKTWGKEGNLKDFQAYIGKTEHLKTFGDIRRSSGR